MPSPFACCSAVRHTVHSGAAADGYQASVGLVTPNKESSLCLLRGSLWELAIGDYVADPERGI